MTPKRRGQRVMHFEETAPVSRAAWDKLKLKSDAEARAKVRRFNETYRKLLPKAPK